MTTRFLTGFIAVSGTITLFPVQAAPIAGCDFANGAAFDSTTDDLLAADGISVSNWSTAGGGAITGDGNGNADRFSAPVGKFNGPTTTGTPPAVGSAPPTLGIHSFTISISAGTTINLTNVSFDFSKATGGSANRWLAFRTSLDTGLLYSANGPARPTLTSVDLDFTDAKYQNLSDTTVTFYWYSGGEGSGDCDIDSIVIDAEVAAANPPTVTNSAATNVEATNATLNGIVTDTGGAAPLITIFYGTSDGGTNPGNWSNSVDLGNEAAAFTTDITGLSPSTHYFFRAYGENSGGIDWAPTSATFTTNAIFPPAIDNAPAINITGTSARVGGEVTNTGGSPPVVTLYWGDNDGGTNTGAWDNSVNLGIQSGAFISDLTNLTQITTYYFRCLAVNGGGSVWASPTETFTTLEVQDLVVNEFMAANDGGVTNNPNAWYPIANQVSGRTDDWIEIANRSAGPLPLDGWFLTDDSGDLTQWAFPAGTSIPGNSFLIVYASGDGIPDANGNLHTNFKLSKGGDYLAIVNPSFTVVSEFASGGSDYPNQNDDVSYGLHPVTELPVFFSSPTPGAANDPNGQAQVGDTKFNLNRGYYQTAINVEITSATQGATIYYTTDGTLPIDTGGTPSASAITYTGPIGLTQTTAVRAAAVKTGLTPTNVDCNTYFLLDIDGAASDGTDSGGLNLPFLQQTQPAGWGSLSSGDYNMDSDVSQETATASNHTTSTAQTMLQGMRDIPTISIVMDREDFSGSNGIYTNSTLKGFAWERACSAEFIPAENDTRSDWQENCGLRVQGGASRNPGSSPKHSLSFRFREDYGVGKLREPLFPGSDVEEFNVIALRAGYNNSWIHSNAGQRGNGSMIRDQWVRQTMLDMGNSAAGEGFMSHVYVNGLYWGLHNICERADASHYGEHKGVDGDLIDARNGSEYTDGNGTAWNQISGVVNSGDWTKIQQVINIDNYIDYQLVNRYGANQDLKTSGNWRAAGGGAFPSGMPEQMS
ncbi:MAG: lamin tail domain-containing protein, partial [Akkermansiaceae bacterium]